MTGAIYGRVMRKIALWLIGVPLTLVVLTAWSGPPNHQPDRVQAAVVAPRNHAGCDCIALKRIPRIAVHNHANATQRGVGQPRQQPQLITRDTRAQHALEHRPE